MPQEEKFIVAIGSSGGGLFPLLTFFDYTPLDQLTYIILRHVPIEYQSHLVDILQPHAKLNVIEGADRMPIEKGVIYIAPASMYIRIEDDRLLLEPRSRYPRHPNWSTDIFLSSLAKAKGSSSIAVILSGFGADGLKGARAVKGAGGMVIAQAPDSCEFPHMPKSAIQTGCVDHVLLPEEMPSVIFRHVNAPGLP